MKQNRFGKWKQSGDALIGNLKGYSSKISNTKLSNPVKSVGMKLFLNFFLSIVIFVLVVGILSYNTSKSIIKQKVAESSLDTIVQAGGKLDIILNQYEQMTMQFIVNAQLQSFMVAVVDPNSDAFTRFDNMRQLQQELGEYLFTDSNILGIHMIMSNDEVVSTGSFNKEAIEGAAWYTKAQEAKGSPVWVSTVAEGIVSTNMKKPTFGIARSLKDPSTGTEVGVVIVELKYDIFENQLETLKSEDGNHTLITDAENKFVYSDETDLLQKDSSIKLTDKPSDKYEGLDQKGQDALIAFYRSELTGWSLVGVYPTEVLVKDARQIMTNTIWIAIAAAILATILSLFVVRMIGRPLVQLRNLMKEGEQGNLQVRTRFKNRDEIGELGQSFNEMMEKITFLVKQTNDSAQQVLNNSGELLEASKKTALSAKEISVATEEIASGASTLAVEAERGNDLTNHISEQMRSVVNANLNMGSSAAEMRKVSEQGTAYMGELITKTNATEDKTRTMVEKVDRLKESTSSIRKILDVLNNLTKQTNILSLNATIEAARAGAAGKGFMVVADEIRKLADQSRQSIDVVAQITETIQTEIDETVKVLSEAYPMFQEQIMSVKEADKIFKEVQNNMSGFIQQLDGVTESIQQLEQSQITLSEAMSSVSAVSQQSSATSEEVASLSSEQLSVSQGLVTLAERLETLSTNLKESLSRFTV